MFKSILKKLRPVKSLVACCPKCGQLESEDGTGDYYYLERARGRDFEDGYTVFSGGWQCDQCKSYEWLIPDDNEWLATQGPDTVLEDVWKVHNEKCEVEEKEAFAQEMKEFERELKEQLEKVESAINVFTKDDSFNVDELMDAGKILIAELEERKSYIIHILDKQAIVLGLNNRDRRLLRCWGYKVEYEDA